MPVIPVVMHPLAYKYFKQSHFCSDGVSGGQLDFIIDHNPTVIVG